METQTTEKPPTAPQIVYHHKRGRPRKVNVRRSAKGKSLGEIVDLTILFEQPHRRGFSDPTSKRLGYALGRLAERRLVSEYQLRVGDRWAAVVCSYRRQLLSCPPLSPKSGEMAERVSTGFAKYETEAVYETDPDKAERDRAELKQKYNACFENLAELGRIMGRSTAISNVVRKVCIDDRDPTKDEVGDLRLGLNSLGQILFPKDGDK